MIECKRLRKVIQILPVFDHCCQEDADAGSLHQTSGPSTLASHLLPFFFFVNFVVFSGIKMYISLNHFIIDIIVTLKVLIILDLGAALWL